MSSYGVFGNLVATAGCLGAAAAGIRLAWMDRAKWQPPEEVLPRAGSKFAGLVAMIFIAWIFVFSHAATLSTIGIASGVLLFISILALTTTIFVNISYSFYYPDNSEEHRFLGGFYLTKEARNIKSKHHQSEQEMIEHVHGLRHKVWPGASRALVNIVSVLSFIILIGAGTSALSAASMLVVNFMNSTSSS